MACKPLPGGGWACTRGPSKDLGPCSSCNSARATVLCDFMLLNGMTCDRKLCRGCAVRVGKGVDYCPAHKRLSDERAAAKEGA